MTDWAIRVAIAAYLAGSVVAVMRLGRTTPAFAARVWKYRVDKAFALSFIVGWVLMCAAVALFWPLRAHRVIWPKQPLHKKCGEPRTAHYYRCPCCLGYTAPGPHGAPKFACCSEVYAGPQIMEYVRSRVCRQKAMPWAYDTCRACERPRSEHDLMCPACGTRHPAPGLGQAWAPCCELDDEQIATLALQRPCPGILAGQYFEGPDIDPQPTHFIVEEELGGEAHRLRRLSERLGVVSPEDLPRVPIVPVRCECGGTIEPATGPGRSRQVDGVEMPIPDDYPIYTCQRCGEEWETLAEAKALDQRLREMKRP